MKSTAELNGLLLKLLLLCQVDVLESSREHNAKFNLLGIIWEYKVLESPFLEIQRA